MISKRNKSLVAGIAFAVFLLLVVMGITTLMPSVSAENDSHSSVTGYFGLDDDGLPIVDRHGIMLVFDGEIAPETVSVDTFEVSLNDGSFAEIVETQVDGAYVFLKLEDELASDATPIVGIADGEEVQDLAGNSTNKRKLGFLQIKDGIAPRLTVALSGGSGRGTGNEGPDRLTRDIIDVRITSEEPLQGAPRVVVVCESLKWTESVDGQDVGRDVEDFIANRKGAFPSKPQEPRGTDYTCGYDADGDGMDDPFQLTEDIANSRPGEVWEYTWRNPAGSTPGLRDGELVVVAYGRDKSRYDRYGEDVSNWAVATGGFGLDTQFNSRNFLQGVRVHPADGATVREKRPFVIIEIPDATSVRLSSVLFDGFEIANEFQKVGFNEFVYWPLSINQGEHEVVVDASDAAGNSIKFDFEFKTVQRGDFVLELHPGWNAISFPSTPVNATIDAVFTEPSIEAVIGWDGNGWSLATQRDGTWESNPQYETLDVVRMGSGYWVKSSGFIRQPVPLRSYDPSLIGKPIVPVFQPGGWNFFGVADQDSDQIEDHFGETLKDSAGNPVNAHDYLGDYDVAFVWDPINRRFERLLPSTNMTIGDGVWVYYSPTGG